MQRPSHRPREHRDGSEGHHGRENKEPAEHKGLLPGGASRGVDELRQKGQEEHRDFRVGEVQDNSPPIESPQSQSRVARCFSAFDGCRERPPSQIG